MILERKKYSEPYYPKHKQTIEFFLWFNTFFKEENKSAEAHFQLVDHLYSKYIYKVIMCHRGLGKSSITLYNILYWLFLGYKPNFGEFDYLLLIQDSVSMVESTFETMISLIENSDLHKYLEIKKKRLGDDPTLYIYNREKDKTIYLKGRGSGQSLRGTRINNKRPNIVILDDIENDEKHMSKDSRTKLKNWFFNVVVPSINPNKYEFIFIGTPIHEDSLLMNLVGSKSWKAIVLPVAEEFPVEDWSKLVTSWKDRFPPEKVVSIYEMLKEQGKEKSFYQEYMLQVTPQDDLLFDLDNINYYKIDDLKDKLNQFTYYVSVDLAVSEKEYADYTAISVVGIDENNNWFLVDGFFGRIKPDETIDKIFEFVEKWRPYAVVLEKVAFQLSMKTFIQNEMVKRGRFFNLEMVSRTKAKLAVIKALQPIVELGRLWLPKEHLKPFVNELIHEMSLITNDSILAKHDDLVDSLAQLTLINVLSVTPIDYNNDFTGEPNEFINPYTF